jgi:hypothetical protein
MSFTSYDPTDIAISSDEVVAPLWTGNITNLQTFATSSTQATSVTGLSYLNVYNLPTYQSGSEVQFSVAYANVSGSGSAPFNTLVPQNTPTMVLYGQFQNLIYGDENAQFTFGGSNFVSGDFYVISISRSRYKEALQPGTLNLNLSVGGTTIKLTDNSNESNDTNFIGSNQYYTIVSGSNGVSYNGTDVQTASGSYGMFFPNISVLILNARALALPANQGGIGITVDQTTSTAYSANYSTNCNAIFSAINAGAGFALQSTETISAAWFFTRVKNQEYNYTTNPSIIDSNGNLLFPTMINNPQTFPTTIGLYNSSNELLAVAKLSKAQPKDFTKELLLSVKLSF